MGISTVDAALIKLREFQALLASAGSLRVVPGGVGILDESQNYYDFPDVSWASTWSDPGSGSVFFVVPSASWSEYEDAWNYASNALKLSNSGFNAFQEGANFRTTITLLVDKLDASRVEFGPDWNPDPPGFPWGALAAVILAGGVVGLVAWSLRRKKQAEKVRQRMRKLRLHKGKDPSRYISVPA